MTKDIIVSATIVKNGEKKFTRYATKLKDSWYRVKFNSTVRVLPQDAGRYVFTVDVDNMSIQESNKTYITDAGEVRKESDILWISGYEDFNKVSEDQLKAENREKVLSLFD